MDINRILDRFWESEDKDTFVTDGKGELIYQSVRNDLPAKTVWEKINSITFDFDEQEFIDKEHSLYFSVRKTVIEEGGEKFTCYHATDVSEYAMLLKEVSSYTKSISKMSKFQTSIMKKLSMSYDTFLPGLADYCKADEVMMYIYNNEVYIRSTYNGELTREIMTSPEGCVEYFALQRGESLGGYSCILNSEVLGQKCVVLIREMSVSGPIDPLDVSIHNVIRLFIENSILRERIVYESEHDRLTGLYNKGKYMALKKENFGDPPSIAIYNFDVNNLKHINDTYGHEYGDSLIVKAAESIKAVTSSNVLGFRMGGDEYVMVALGISEEEAESVRDSWRASLDKLNKEDDTIFCAMACGLAYASGSFVYDDLYALSDKLMYEDKKNLKSNGITSRLKDH
ncbi:MAG: GGDEF domain-containing protein [Ruminococcus sp.]|nr:GGDEF domain-containing protein [Ruminococcus sp.]